MSPLEDGVRTESSGGGSGLDGILSSGGTSANSPSNATGGIAPAGTGGTSAAVVTGIAGAAAEPPNTWGPWNFDSPESSLNGDWKVITGKTVLGWVAAGELVPYGALLIDASASTLGETVHIIEPTNSASFSGHPEDLRSFDFGILARASSGSASVRLFCVDSSFVSGSTALVPLNTLEWTRLEFRFSQPDVTSLFDASRVMYLGISVPGGQKIWVDQAWLVNRATVDAGLTDASP